LSFIARLQCALPPHCCDAFPPYDRVWWQSQWPTFSANLISHWLNVI
jgi:hypothetical protein